MSGVGNGARRSRRQNGARKWLISIASSHRARWLAHQRRVSALGCARGERITPTAHRHLLQRGAHIACFARIARRKARIDSHGTRYRAPPLFIASRIICAYRGAHMAHNSSILRRRARASTRGARMAHQHRVASTSPRANINSRRRRASEERVINEARFGGMAGSGL